LRANQHAPFAGGRCNTCHGSVQGGTFALKEDVKTLCLECHRGIEAFENTAHHHNLDDERSCANCHNAHASDGEFLLAASPEVLCMRCHFNDPGEKTKADYLTHDGMTCTECHVPHGSDDPKYLKTREVDLCARCHQAAHRVTHPVGEDVIDPRTGESVTCVSCHQMHGPDFADYLPLDPSSDLCIQCHRR
jgi:predicted CXXCH cytochrome family protein